MKTPISRAGHACSRIIWFALVLCLVGAESVRALTPLQFWKQRFGGTSVDLGSSVATDPSGNIIVAGSFSATLNLGGADLVSAGGYDIFVAKYNAAGAHQWSQRFGSSGTDAGYSVATDASGNVFVTGIFSGTVNFGGTDLVSAGSYDIFVAKYSAAGVHLWSQRFGSTGLDFGYSVATDPSGNVVVAGLFNATVNFGGIGLVSAGLEDVFVAKYNAAGVHQWSQRFGSTGTDAGYSVATDASGNVVVTGAFNGTVNFGGIGLVSAGLDDIFVAKYDAAGVHQWSQRFGSTSNDYGRSVAVDPSGNVAVTGSFIGTVNLGGANLVSAGGADIFVAKYNAAGAHQWSHRYGGTTTDVGYSIATDASENVAVTGIFSATADFGGGNLVSAGGRDIFLAAYDPSGAHQWSRRFGSTFEDWGQAVAADVWGRVVVVGYFRGTASFDTGDLVSAGFDDIFVVKYSPEPAQPVITSISDTGNDQGRMVKIRFAHSGWDDVAAPSPVTHYAVFRRDDAPPAATLPGDRMTLEDGWTEVGSVSAFAQDSYGINVPTIGDSTEVAGQYYSTFFIRAATDAMATYYDSAPDSGYSVDNLAPPMSGVLHYSGGMLSWNPSAAEDFNYFTVYGSNVDAFGSATVVDYSVAPSKDVTSAGYAFYFVSATDFSGNEGKAIKINTASGVGTPKSYVLSVSNFPNPFNPSTTVSYTVPSRGNVTVSIYDAHGALVAMLVNNEPRDAGAYRMEWNGQTSTGAGVSSGIYFARIEHNGDVRAKKMVLLK